MRNLTVSSFRNIVGVLSFFAALAVPCGNLGGLIGLTAAEAKIIEGAGKSDESAAALDKSHPAVKEAMAVQNRHTPMLMSHPDVVGTATGLDDAGQPAVLVFTKKALAEGVLPRDLEGKRVVLKVTGEILAMPGKPGKKNGINPTARFNRPVPIGISTGNEGECSAGTIGARVKSGSNVYALSNNHVYALENLAQPNSKILQPGRYDTSCTMSDDNVIGTLFDYVPINFAANNTVDAAIAFTTTANVGQATPSNGYGLPKSVTTTAGLGAAVQKYGRTTSLTKGTIVGVNSTIRVGYSAGIATFVNQVVINGRSFIKAGDSGSLLVTDPGRNPVGLLFAGNSSGSYAFANPIDPVLSSFGVTIDGE